MNTPDPLHFHGDQIAVVKLCDWLDWVTLSSHDVAVALPMIQRGSVWKPRQIVDLWDSLLRGMPVGSMTVSRLDEEQITTYRVVSEKEAKTEKLQKGTLFLLDGQQRTLAMCVGWSACADRRVWVDFGKAGKDGRPFHLRVTTQSQPFGFQADDQDKKLSRGDRDKAREAFDKHSNDKGDSDVRPNHSLPLDLTLPFGAVYPLALHDLISSWRLSGNDVAKWSHNTMTTLALPESTDAAKVMERITAFGHALASLFEAQLALVRVQKTLIEPADADNSDDVPALVVLFQRIANAGKPLSNADYIFSLIKHRFPEAHNLVNSLHAQHHVASLLSANDLVMTAVRIAAAANRHSGGQPFGDYVSRTPKEFGRLLRSRVDGGDGFLQTALMPLIMAENSYSLHRAFEALQWVLEYRTSILDDPGLPRLAFPLLQSQLVQVLLFWIHKNQRSITDAELLAHLMEASRAEILRFVLFWLLCIEDKAKASRHCISLLRDGEHQAFPGKALYHLLYEEDIAYGIQPLNYFRDVALSNATNAAPIRFWETRFGGEETDLIKREAKALYCRWFHKKSLLLYLQRHMLSENFPHADPLAGRDDETPYDYDHICPQNDWGQDNRSCESPLRNHCEYKRADIIGNCIGNYRILDSRINRHLQDSPADKKLCLDKLEQAQTQHLLTDSAVDVDQALNWRDVSRFEKQGEWTQARAIAFQRTVEQRSFRLFEKYYKTAGFEAWLGTEVS